MTLARDGTSRSPRVLTPALKKPNVPIAAAPPSWYPIAGPPTATLRATTATNPALAPAVTAPVVEMRRVAR
jgi:hypothetical protein